jgi:pantoate--beta-alanine ligase
MSPTSKQASFPTNLYIAFDGAELKVIPTIADLRSTLASARNVCLVPTMGNLHRGHLSLVAIARERGDIVVASIFVNQLQFAPHEDFAKYPRTLERDSALLNEAGCDIVFAPAPEEMYPEPQECKVYPPPELADILEGHSRPGFFVGVATVVLKLLNIVQPSVAVFGKKDYQQLLVVRNLVRQFALPVQIIAAETVREPSGIALSSRNGYLTDDQRLEAAYLYRALRAAVADSKSGKTPRDDIEAAAIESLRLRGWQPDYIAIRRRQDLRIPGKQDQLVILGAARLGDTRLIDNIEF